MISLIMAVGRADAALYGQHGQALQHHTFELIPVARSAARAWTLALPLSYITVGIHLCLTLSMFRGEMNNFHSVPYLSKDSNTLIFFSFYFSIFVLDQSIYLVL